MINLNKIITTVIYNIKFQLFLIVTNELPLDFKIKLYLKYCKLYIYFIGRVIRRKYLNKKFLLYIINEFKLFNYYNFIITVLLELLKTVSTLKNYLLLFKEIIIILIEKYYFNKSGITICIRFIKNLNLTYLLLYMEGKLDIYQSIKNYINYYYEFTCFLIELLLDMYYHKYNYNYFILKSVRNLKFFQFLQDFTQDTKLILKRSLLATYLLIYVSYFAYLIYFGPYMWFITFAFHRPEAWWFLPSIMYYVSITT